MIPFIQFPMPLIKLFRTAGKLSDLIDNKLFPLPKSYNDDELAKKRRQQQRVETAASFIGKQISFCKTIAQCCNCRRMITNLSEVYGLTEQVKCCQANLTLKVIRRENKIIHNL